MISSTIDIELTLDSSAEISAPFNKDSCELSEEGLFLAESFAHLSKTLCLTSFITDFVMLFTTLGGQVFINSMIAGSFSIFSV